MTTNKLNLVLPLCLLTILLFTACKPPVEEPPLDLTLDDQIAMLNLEALPPVRDPANNLSTPEKIELGKILFWDPIVGGEKDIACATCHHPDLGYADGLDLPIGVGGTGLGPNRVMGPGRHRVPRNSPSIINTAYNGVLNGSPYYRPEQAVMFWDGRFESLETQCQKPPTSGAEMAGTAYGPGDKFEMAVDSVVERLKKIPTYVMLFDAAFEGSNTINKENYAKAIAAFERTIVSNNSRYDRYIRGETYALTEAEKKGLLLFYGKAQCGSCHIGPMFSDWQFYALGVEDNPLRPSLPDYGKDSVFKFRTPTIRNVTLTAPYMHSGMHTDLREVMDFYNAGYSRNSHVPQAEGMQPLGLTETEINDVISFMESLTDDKFDKTIPSGVPSGLPVGGNM